MLTTLLFLLLLSIGSASRMSVFFVSHYEDGVRARLQARSVINLASARLKAGEVGLSEDISYPSDASDSERGKLSFTGEGHRSTNNLTSSSAVMGSLGVIVPARSVHLVATSQVGKAEVVSDAILRMPHLPFSIASAGAIRGEDMEVFSVESLEALSSGVVSEEDKLPGNLVSNYVGARNSVELGSNTLVTGDVRAAGGADTNRAQVRGEVLTGQDPQNLPEVNPLDYDPLRNDEPRFDFLPGTTTEVVKGKARYQGELTVTDLTLSEGLLFVDGNLTISGRLLGKGAIVATGDITVTGAMNTSSDLTALVAGGNVVVEGRGRGATSLRGLVYAKGSFKAKDATVVGAVVSADVDGVNEFERVNLVETPELRQMEIWVDVGLDKVMGSARGERGGSAPIGLLYQGQFTAFDPANEAELRLLAKELVTSGSSDGKVVAEIAPEQYSENPEGAVDIAKKKASKTWTEYLAAVKSNSEERREIFSLDLNSFLSVESGLELLLFRANALGAPEGGS